MKWAWFCSIAIASFVLSTAAVAEEKKEDTPKGFLIYEKGDTKIAIGGQLQVQLAPFAGESNLLSNNDLAQEEGFRLRRTRIKFRGQLDKTLTFALSTELKDDEDSGGNLLDAWLDWTPLKNDTLSLGLKGGAVELAWTRSTLISSAFQSATERPFAIRAMAPRRQAGAMVHAGFLKDMIRLNLGAYNSLHRKGNFFQGYEEVGQSLGNRLSRFAYAARLDVEPTVGSGKMKMSVPDAEKEDSLRANIGAGYFYNDGAAFKIHGLAVDAHVKWNGLALFGGFVWDTHEPGDEPTETVVNEKISEDSRSGWFAEADYTIMKEKFGVHARYEQVDTGAGMDDDLQDVVTVGANLYAYDQKVKVQLEYIHRVANGFNCDGKFKTDEWTGFDRDTLLAQVQVAF